MKPKCLNKLKFKISDWLIFVVIYCIANGVMLFNNGLYIDDWVFWNVPPEIVLDTIHQAGLFWFGYLHIFMFSFDNGILFYRILIFTSFLLSALLLNNILKIVKEIDSPDRFVIILFFILFPVNSARTWLITGVYALSYFLFFFGAWLLSRRISGSGNQIGFRLLSLSLFFISFATQSLLVFYTLVLVYIGYLYNIRTIDKLVDISKKHVDYLLLPLFFWALKQIFFVPYGLYEGQYRIGLDTLMGVPTGILITFYTSFLEVFDVAFVSLSFTLLVSTIFLMLFLKFNKRVPIQEYDLLYRERTKHDLYLFSFGIFAFIVAIFPYLAVGKLPNLYDWNSRDQLLIPLSAGFMIVYGVKLFTSKFDLKLFTRYFVYCLLIVVFINTNFNNHIAYQRDWYKQESLIENIKVNREIHNHTTILFQDNTLDYNVNHRFYRFYEYTGMMKLAYGDETRFGDNMDFYTLHNMSYYSVVLTEYYNMKNYAPHEPDLLVKINRGKYELTDRNTIRLMLAKRFDREIYVRNILNVLNLTT